MTNSGDLPIRTSARRWICIILDNLEALSDYELQVRAWTGAGPEVWSPCEAVDEAEDIQIDGFVKQGCAFLSGETIAAIHRVNRFIDDSDISDNDMKTAADTPLWFEIRRLAGEALNLFASDVGQAGFSDLLSMSSEERLTV